MRKLTLMTAVSTFVLGLSLAGPAAADPDNQDVINSNVAGSVDVGGTLFSGNLIEDNLNVNQTVLGNNMNFDASSAPVTVDGTTDQTVRNSNVTGAVNVGGFAVGGNDIGDNVNVTNTVVGNSVNADASGTLDSDQLVRNSNVTSATDVGGFGFGGNLVGDNVNVNQTVVGNNFDFTFTGGGEATVDQDVVNSNVTSTVDIGGVGLGANLVDDNVNVTNTAVGNNASWDVDL